MSYSEAVARVAQIQGELAALKTGVDPSQGASATPQGAPGSFAETLARAQAAGSPEATGQAASTSPYGEALPTGSVGTSGVASATGGAGAASGAPLSQAAQAQLTPGQQQFASRLAADTGLNPQVVSAWLLAEESGEAAHSREAQGNNDWLNIGYTDSGTFGSGDSVWSSPLSAAEATAGWLKGQDTIPGYGTASSGIQGIVATVGQSPESQIAAIQQSGWASSGYPDLPSLFEQVVG